MLRINFLILFLLLSSFLSAQEGYRSRIFPKEGTLGSEVGDTIEIIIEIMPAYKLNEAEVIRQIENKHILPFLYLLEIDEIYSHPNNEDVLVVKGIGIISDKITKDSYTLNINDRNYQIDVSKLKEMISGEARKVKNFTFLEQPFQGKIAWFWIIAIMIVMVAALYVLGRWISIRQKYEKNIRQQRQQYLQRINHWKEKMYSASNREDIEEIAKCSREWQQFLGGNSNLYKEFQSTLDNYQYRPTWENEYIVELKTILDKLAEVLEQKESKERTAK